MRRLVELFAVVLTLLPLWGVAETLPFATAEAEYRQVEQLRTFDAVVETVKTATISAQTSGQITEIHFDIDDFVEKDSILIRLRDKEQRAAVKAAEARSNEAAATYRRIEGLLERKLVSKAEFDRASAALKSARAQLEQAQEQLDHTVIRAPYSGIVVERHVEPGEVASPGSPLMTGISLEQLRAITTVPQSYIGAVRRMSRALIYLPDASRPPLQAESVTVTPRADPATHSFRVRVDLPAADDHNLYPGMFVKVGFVVGEQRQLLVDSRAVVYRSEVTGIYVVDDKNGIRFRQVRAGQPRPDGLQVVHAGLSEGERVALEPIKAGVYLKQLREGAGR